MLRKDPAALTNRPAASTHTRRGMSRTLPMLAPHRPLSCPAMAVRLRPVRRQDGPALAGLLGHPATGVAVTERLDYWLDDPSGWLLGADDEGVLIGVAALGVLPGLATAGKFGRLLTLVVDERYRGRGVGRSLVAAVEEHARAIGCTRMEATGSQFYEQL